MCPSDDAWVYLFVGHPFDEAMTYCLRFFEMQSPWEYADALNRCSFWPGVDSKGDTNGPKVVVGRHRHEEVGRQFTSRN